MCLCVCEQQLDYDSRVVQRRLYQEALLEITLPALTRRMDSKWKSVGQIHLCSLSVPLSLIYLNTHTDLFILCVTAIQSVLQSVTFSVQELKQYEQYIFSDYSSFILVHNVYDDVLQNILRKEIETGKDTHARLTHTHRSFWLDISSRLNQIL